MSAVYTSNIVFESSSTTKSSAAGQRDSLDLASSFTSSDTAFVISGASSSAAPNSPSSSRNPLMEFPSIQDNERSSYSPAQRRVIVTVDDLEENAYAEEEFYSSSHDCSLDSSFDSSDFEVDSSITGDFLSSAQTRRVLAVQTFHIVSVVSNRALFTIAECSPAPESDATSIDSSFADSIPTKPSAVRRFFKRCFRTGIQSCSKQDVVLHTMSL
ncbi:hypothetical protein CPB85DRAFT_1286604 [Mucidula mucida]|nr:hypothetical protein CPB85DRAFT_1286604 [Mucidula mucida]